MNSTIEERKKKRLRKILKRRKATMKVVENDVKIVLQMIEGKTQTNKQ